MSLLHSIGLLDTILVTIAFLFFVGYWSIMSYSLKIFGAFIGFSFLIQTSSFTIPYLGYHNLWLLHIFTLGEFIILSLFYRQLFTKNPKLKQFIAYFLPIGSLLIILNTIFLQSLTEYNSYAKTFVQCFTIAYSVYYFYILSTREILTEQRFKALHLINSAILLYYAGSFFIFMFANISVLISGEMSTSFWDFNAFLYLTFLILVLISLYKTITSERI